MIRKIAGAVGIFGFCLMIHVEKRHICFPLLGGVAYFRLFLLLESIGFQKFSAVYLATIIIGIYGECFSRLFSVPTTVYFVPSCILLIPGSNLYYALVGMLSQDWNAFHDNVFLLILYAVGIAFGFATVQEADHIYSELKRKMVRHTVK